MNWHLEKITGFVFVVTMLAAFDMQGSSGSFGPTGYVTSFLSEEDELPGTFFGGAFDDEDLGYYLAAGVTKGGNGIITRYTSAGVVDTVFNGGSAINTAVSVWYGIATDFSNTPIGAVVVGQNNAGYGIIARYVCGFTAGTAGTLDTTFGTNGCVVNKMVSSWFGVAINEYTGDLIAVGTTVGGFGIVARYTSAGVLDTTFNSTGYVISGTSNTNAACWYGVALDDVDSTSSNIIVAGQTNSNAAVVARYTSTGALDTNFNTNGYVISSSADTYASQWTSVTYAVDESNSNAPVIVVAGSTQSGQAIVACYKGSTGTISGLYTHFNTTGFVTSTSADTKATTWSSLGTYSSFDDPFIIAVAGTTSTGYGVIAQYLGTGALNSGEFNPSHGYVISTSANTNAQQWYGLIYDSGKPVPVGVSNTGYGIVASYTSAGALDTMNFNATNGFITSTPIGTYGTVWNSIALDPNNNYVVAGQSNTGYGMIARYTDGGFLDSTFNPTGASQGTVVIDGLGGNSPITLTAVALDGNNNVVVVGATSIGNGVIVRYTSAGALDSSFNSGSVSGGPGYVTSSLPVQGWKDVAIDSSNNVVVVGEITGGDGIVARYTAAGALDTANFNPNSGYVTSNLVNEGFVALEIDSVNYIVAVGNYNNTLDGTHYFDSVAVSYTESGAANVNFYENGNCLNIDNINLADILNNINLYSLVLYAVGSYLSTGFVELLSVDADDGGAVSTNGFTWVLWNALAGAENSSTIYSAGAYAFNVPGEGGYVACYNIGSGLLFPDFNGTGFVSSFAATNAKSWNDIIVDQNGNVVVVGERSTGQAIIASYYSNGTLAAPANFNSTVWKQQCQGAGLPSGVI